MEHKAQWVLSMRLRDLVTSGLFLLSGAMGPTACTSDGAAGSGDQDERGVGPVFLVTDGLPGSAVDRITQLLTKPAGGKISVVAAEKLPSSLPSDALVVSLGPTSVTRGLISEADLSALGPEGFRVREGQFGGATLLAADGNPAKDRPHNNLGLLHGAYALLEELGFAFLHPLAPTVPDHLVMPEKVDLQEQPRWDRRIIHLHTQHPLELTELLQGWGGGGPDDEAGFKAMLPEWDRFLEWSVANRQNGVEWFLLWASSWQDFADSQARIDRLSTLVDHAHSWGLTAGIDAPIAFAQQHSFRLLRDQGNLDDELAQIRSRVDWLMQADWDFMGIESGTSEFTHPPPDRQLA
jgi:hypothetical protein